MSQIKRNFKESQSLSLCVSNSDVTPMENNIKNGKNSKNKCLNVVSKTPQVLGLLNLNRKLVFKQQSPVLSCYFLFDANKALLTSVSFDCFNRSNGQVWEYKNGKKTKIMNCSKNDCIKIFKLYDVPIWNTNSGSSKLSMETCYIIPSQMEYLCESLKMLMDHKFVNVGRLRFTVEYVLPENDMFCNQVNFLDTDKFVYENIEESNFKAKWNTHMFGMSSNFITGVNTFISAVSQVGKIKGVVTDNDVMVKVFLSSVLSLLNKVTSLCDGQLSVSNMLDYLLDMYRVFITGGFLKEQWNSHMMIAGVSLAAASTLLPPKLFEIFRRISLFTTAKILDDVTGLFSFYSLIMDFIKNTIDASPFKCPQFILDFFEHYLNLEVYKLAFEAKSIYTEWRKNPKIVIDLDFRSRVCKLTISIKNSGSLSEWSRRSPGVSLILKQFDIVNKTVQAYLQSNRVEPCCFVFQGPPGCFKSVYMNKLIRVMETSAYAHIVKSTSDGKDFYDTYNNETIFRMDDVGQQSKSQWRNIINLVSPTKLPLDCASVDLKDTVYFSSEIMFLTTNSFMKLTGFTAQDGVSDMEALFRRGYVFDYYEVKRDIGKLVGNIYFKHYDQGSKVFVNDFPQDFKNYLVKMRVFIPTFSDASDQDELLVWMTTIIEGVKRMKQEQYDVNVMPNDQIDRIRAKNVFLNPIVDVPIVNYLGEGKPGDKPGKLEGPTRLIYGLDGEPVLEYDEERGFVNRVLEDSLGEELTTEEKSDGSYYQYFLDIFTSYKDYLMDILTSQLSKLLMLLGSVDATEYIGLICAACTIVCILLYHKYIFPNRKMPSEKVEMKNMILEYDLDTKEFYSYKAQTIIPPVVQEFVQTVRDADYSENRHSMVSAVAKQQFLCRFVTDAKTEFCYGLISGKYVIVPNHVCFDSRAQLTVYRDHDKNNIMIDNMVVKKKYKNNKNDLAIWSLLVGYPSPLKDLSKCFKETVEVVRDLVFENYVIPVERIRAAGASSMMYEVQESFYNKIDNPFYYNIHFPGMCGSLLLSDKGNVMGMHLAGSNEERKGVSILWSKEVRAEIAAVLRQPNGLLMNTEISPKTFENMSGIKLQAELATSTPNRTKLIPSPLYGVFDIDRMPANLAPYGCHTVKTILKQAMVPIKTMKFEELDFAKKVVDIIIEPFGDLTDTEVIGGTELLARINKDSSNGYFPIKTKDECFDYEKKEMKPEFEKLYVEFLEKMKNDLIEQKDIVFIESVKDELRSITKKEPRTFRMCSVAMQYATKKIFGKMVENIISKREFNKIMIGVNPFKDWRHIYKKLVPDATFDGDAKSFDKKMLAQVQQFVNESLLAKYTGEYRDLARKLLELLTYTVVCGNDDVFMMTHSFPSGCFLTAIFNSLINRFYAAMWYKRYYKLATPLSFYKNVADYNYGDDKMVSILNPELKGVLNAVTMCEFFESIGIEFTNAQKTRIDKPFNDLLEITFLKRHFVYHSRLESIVGPLDTSTLYSGLSFLDGSKDATQVLQDKIHNFQREMYLHEELYEDAVAHLEGVCRERGVVFERLPESYLIALYQEGEYDREYNRKYGLIN